MKLIIISFFLNITTGETTGLKVESTEPYATYTECNADVLKYGPQQPANGLVKLFTCAIEKQII